MKSFNKILFALMGVMLLAFTSCQEEIPVREPSPAAPENSMEVLFSVENPTTVELGLTDTEYTIELRRSIYDAETVVPVQVECDELLSCPETVTFAAGDSTASYTITLKEGMEPFVPYMAEIRISNEFTNPYLSGENGTQEYCVKLMKNDWKNHSKGIYVSNFFTDAAGNPAQWENMMLYSEILKQYKLLDVYAVGYDIVFKVNEDGVVSLAEGSEVETGYEHPSYGMVSFEILPASNFVDDVVTLVGNMNVSAGSFGSTVEGLIITEKY